MKSAVLQYANALADIALQQGAAEPLVKQLREFTTLFKDSAELRNFLASPAITRTVKHGVIEKIAAQAGAGKVLRNFLFVLVDNQRTPMLPEIAVALEEVLRQRQGVAQADVTSAAELSATQKKELQETLEQVTGKKIQPSYTLDAALLGGAVVRVGSTVYDGSVRNQLERLRARLVAE